MDEQSYLQRASECERSLYRVAKTILFSDADCADAVQQTVFRGWVKRQQLRDPERFKPWLTRILINECRNIQRRDARQWRVTEAVGRKLETSAAQEPGPSDPSDAAALREALSALPEDYRLPVTLHYLEGYSIREIAIMLRVPERRVTERMYRARRRLEEALKL